jgi:hypothetical protein
LKWFEFAKADWIKMIAPNAMVTMQRGRNRSPGVKETFLDGDL